MSPLMMEFILKGAYFKFSRIPVWLAERCVSTFQYAGLLFFFLHRMSLTEVPPGEDLFFLSEYHFLTYVLKVLN